MAYTREERSVPQRSTAACKHSPDTQGAQPIAAPRWSAIGDDGAATIDGRALPRHARDEAGDAR